MALLPHRLKLILDRVLVVRTARGPYRFLIKNWEAISDMDLAVQVLGTEFFRTDLKPYPIPLETIRSMLVLAPHQDDEAIGVGGTLALAADAGIKLDVLYVTDGVQFGSRFPYNPDESRAVRRAESRKFCETIGATMHELSIDNPRPAPGVGDVDRFAVLVRELEPQVIVTPWLLDLPAKHRIPNHLLWLANKRGSLPQCEVWGYQIHNTLYPNAYVDITAVQERKRELIRCFQSQLTYYNRYDHVAMGMSAWNSRFLTPAPVERYVEVFFTLPLKEHLALIERFYFTDLAATYQGDLNVIPGMRAIHDTITGSE